MVKRTRVVLNLILAFILLVLPACGQPAPKTPAPAPTATLSVAVDMQRADAGPQIIAQTPIKGQRLDLEPVIQLVFDRDMNQQATEAAWSLTDAAGNSVPGRASWVDGRTFEFTPDTKLLPGSDYTGTFATSASDASGKSPASELRLDFHTVDAFTVGQVFPADGTQDIDPHTSITVVFNRPAVPLTIEEEQADLPQPLEFSPGVSGKGEWVNSSMYIFKPDKILDAGTSYLVRIAAGLEDVTGNVLEADYTWQFTTRPVTGFVQLKKFDNLLLDQEITVVFLQPMDTKSVARALNLIDRVSGQTFPIQLKWNSDATTLSIKPAGWYRIAGFYRLTISQAALAQDGGSLTSPIELDFSTLPLPRVDEVYPEPNSKAETYDSMISIKFSSPMNFDSLKDRVKVLPQPSKVSWYYDQYRWGLYMYGLEPSTDYIVRILPGMTDIYGNTIASEYSYSFRTGELSAHALLLAPGTPLVYRAKGPQDMFIEYDNLDWAEILLYPLSFQEFTALNQPKTDLAAFEPQAAPLRQWRPDVLVVRNRTVRIQLDFKDEAGAALPPGYYFIGLKASPFDYSTNFMQGRLFVVATDNITFKTTGTEALVWLTDLETGRPAADVPVVVYNENFTEIGRARTDGDGLAYLDGLDKPYYVRAAGGNHEAFASQAWGSGVSAGQFGLWWNYYTEYSKQFVYIYTERPLYRPGQDVFFKGLVRLNDDLRYSLPDQAQVYVTVKRQDSTLYAQNLNLSDMGSFTGKFHLDDDAALGSYVISVFASSSEEEPFGSVAFRVAEYHKPEFQVLATPSVPGVLTGEEYSIDLDASYYSGGSVGNADVSWYMEASPYYFRASRDYALFSFSDWDRDEYWSDPQVRTPVVLSEGTDKTDENGHLTVDQVATLGKNNTSRQVQFYANVTDVAGNLVSTHAGIVFHQSEVYAGIRASQYIGEQGKAQTFELAVLDWDSNPVKGQAVSVDIVQRRWYSVQQQDSRGQLRWVTSVKDIPVTRFSNVVTGEKGLASVSFTPAAGGIYKATVTVRDSKNRTQHASTFLWVSGGEYVPWRQTNDRSFNIVADRDTYTPGDTAEILIAQPFKDEVYGLVTVERGHVYSREVIRLDSTSMIYKLPIVKEMAPATYISVLVIRGAGESGSPDFKMSMLRLNVDTSQQTLDVTVRSDKSAAGPGDAVTYTVETRDAAGKPVQADVSLALVDKAVLALAPANSLPIPDAFYPVRALSVVTSVGIVTSADDFNANYTETPPEGEHSGGGGGKGVGDEGIINVREYFRDTAFYQAQVKTDENGIARVTVTLPENLTTWQMDARAATADSRVGQTTHELLSTKPLFVQLQTPRFFTAGDTALIGATVFNNNTNALNVKVSLEAQGVELLTPSEQTIAVKGRQQAYVTWEVGVIPGAARVDLTAHAAGGGYEDASKPALGTLEGQGIPVYAYHVAEVVGTAGLLSGADSATEAIRLPGSIPYEEATLNIEIEPSLAASVKNGLTYLEDYPYSCMEQTTSRLLSNVVTSRVLQLSRQANPQLQSNLDIQINTALQRIDHEQMSDGGWGWWGGQSDPLTTAYVVYGLMQARQAGYLVSNDVVNNGIDFLNSNLPSLTQDTPTWMYNRQAYLLYVLVFAGKPNAYRTIALFDQRERLSLYGKAFLAQALYLRDNKDERVSTLIAELMAASVNSAAGTHWEEDNGDIWNWGSDLRTTAIVLNAFVQIDPTNPTAANAVRWLMAHRSMSSWGSTQETTWTMLALTHWLEVSKEFETSYHYAVGLNSNLLQEGDASPANLAEAVKLQVGLKQMLADEANYLVFARSEGNGNLYYTTYMDVVMPVSQIEPLDQGIIVSRQYFGLEDNKKPVTEVKRGDLVRVRVTITAPSSLHYLVVNDPLPAGLEAIDASLLTGVEVPSKYTLKDFDERGWGWWYFYHAELRDEVVVLSTDYLPAGTYVYTYLARASTAGTFSVIPTTAQEFYFPDVAGRGAGSEFVVKP